MTDTGRSSRDPEVRPSKFGAGYTVGGPPLAPTPVAPAPTTAARTPQPAASPIQRPYIATPAVSASPLSAGSADGAGSNLLATISLALVVLFGAIVSPITLVMGYIARSQIKRTGQRGAERALATLVVSYVFLGIGLLSVALVEFGAV